MDEKLKIVISAEINDLKNKVKQAKAEINGMDSATKKAAENVDKNFKKMGQGITKALKTAAKATTAVSAAIGGITVAAVKGFADYQQLSGGVEKLFQNSANVIFKYADNAYKASGMTANQYMETVTGFSAGLIASMGGDTARAAEVANMAINDMADNASVFGTSIGDIENAYQGFAKQNYSMLDNLKLGFGGSKEEMQRLLDKAHELSGIEYDISSLDDVYNAIHVVQEAMDITGNAADEASKTISGTVNAAKASWSNLMVGLANDEANIPELVSNVVSSSAAVLENIVPIVKEVLESIPEAIAEISPEAGQAFQAILDIATPIFETLREVVSFTFGAIIDGLAFIEEHNTAFIVMASAVGVLTTAVGIYNAVQAVKTAMNVAEVTSVKALIASYTAQAAAMVVAIAPYALAVAAIAAVIAIIVVCIKHWDEIKEACANAWNSIKEKTSEAAANVKQKFSDMKAAISDKVEGIKSSVREKFEGIKSSMGEKIEAAKSIVSGKFEAIKSKIEEKINGARDVVKKGIDKIKSFFDFSWDLPKIKLPHFTITGGFSLVPPKAPSFSIDWYANGGVFDKPTLFNYGNGSLGGLGEAGAEAVVPLEKNTKWLDRIADRLAGKQAPIILQVDGKTFGEIAVDSINGITKQTGNLPLRLI